MDANQFDALTMRIIAPLTRRRGLGLLGVLGAAGLGLAALPAEIEAGKKGKRKRKGKGKGKGKGNRDKTPKCTGCTSCEACVDGACQPLADGAPCGDGGVCTNDVCGQPCIYSDDQCPDGTLCPLEDTVCVSEIICTVTCVTDADCETGQICMVAPCNLPGFYCGVIAPI